MAHLEPAPADPRIARMEALYALAKGTSAIAVAAEKQLNVLFVDFVWGE